MEEPFVITTFATGSKLPQISSIDYSSNKINSRLIVSANQIGINVFDAADQTTLSSLTLGAGFKPTTAVVSRSIPTTSTESVRIKGLRNTWIGVEASEGGEIWNWIEEERKDGSTDGNATKVVYPSQHRIEALAAPKSLPNHIIILNSAGELSVAAESDLKMVATLPPTATLPTLQNLSLFKIDTNTNSFLPENILNLIPEGSKAHLGFVVRSFESRTTSPSMVEISKKKFKKTKRPLSASLNESTDADIAVDESHLRSEIEIVVIDAAVENEGVNCVGIISLGRVEVTGSQVVISEDGFISSLDRNGLLCSHRLIFDSDSVYPAVYIDLFTTSSLSFQLNPLKQFSLSTSTLSATSRSGITILPLHSSFLMVASVRPRLNTTLTPEDPPTKVVLLIWDILLGAVVSELKVSIPSAALPTPETIESRKVIVSLNYISKKLVGLIVSPKIGFNGRAVIFAVPISLPSASVLAIVVGKQSLTKKYLNGLESIIQKAAKVEPSRNPKTGKNKLVLIEASEKARKDLLARLEVVLNVLENPKASLASIDQAISNADDLFGSFIEQEQERLTAYNINKIQIASEKEKDRRRANLEEKNKLQVTTKKYRSNRRKIEAAIAAQPNVSWSEVTAKRLKNVGDVYRFKYFEVRKSLEEAMGQIVVETNLDHAIKAMQRQEPTLPSTFVTALLRLSFPGYLSTRLDLNSSSTSTARIWKHPTGIISYLLEHNLVGDNMVEGGVVRCLARSGDWANIQVALSTMVDIPESTTVALLKTVITHHLLPIQTETPPPSLFNFLTVFLTCPTTSSTLIQVLKSTLTAIELIPVLQILNDWLSWWSKHGGGGGEVGEDKSWKEEGRKPPKRLSVNPFRTMAVDGEDSEEVTPPRLEDILPFVQNILDAHFINLLLQRSSHSLLTSISNQIQTHLLLSSNLNELVGALSIYSNVKKENKISNGKEVKVASGMSTMDSRIKAQEKHAEVGEYGLDRFFL